MELSDRYRCGKSGGNYDVDMLLFLARLIRSRDSKSSDGDVAMSRQRKQEDSKNSKEAGRTYKSAKVQRRRAEKARMNSETERASEHIRR